VVVAIIALLIAILGGSLQDSLRRAKQIKCAANLRQLGQAFAMYAADHRGRVMPLYYARTLANTDSDVYWWGTNSPTAVDHTRGFVWQYLGSDLKREGLYECPMQPWGSYQPQGSAVAVTSTYGYNGYYLSPAFAPGWNIVIRSRPWQQIERIPQPDRVFAFADTLLNMDGDLFNTALLDPPFIAARAAGRWVWRRNESPTTAFRHAGRTNAAFADGHVAPCGPERGSFDPETLIGSAGDTNDPRYIPDWSDW